MSISSTSFPAASGVVVTPASGASLGYRGFTVRNSSASARVGFELRATDASGALLEAVTLAAGESAREFYDPAIDVGPDAVLHCEIVEGAATDLVGSVRTEA